MPRKQFSTRVEGRSEGGPSGDFPRPRRRFGQNFLVAPGAIARIVEALDPLDGEDVVEIGSGRGALTEALLARVRPVTAIEIDRDLAAALSARFPPEHLRVVTADVLELDLAELAPPGKRLTIAGNLPYNVSKPIVMRLVRARAAVDRAVLMFQREVANRLCAHPGTKDYGPLTVLAGRAFSIERLFDLPPGAFHPSPKVTSTVTRWRPRPPEDLPDELAAPLQAVLAASFGRRRQTLLRNLRETLAGGEAEAKDLLARAELDGRLRAESIPPDGFMALARAWILR